jgi:hypothetical protein
LQDNSFPHLNLAIPWIPDAQINSGLKKKLEQNYNKNLMNLPCFLFCENKLEFCTGIKTKIAL